MCNSEIYTALSYWTIIKHFVSGTRILKMCNISLLVLYVLGDCEDMGHLSLEIENQGLDLAFNL